MYVTMASSDSISSFTSLAFSCLYAKVMDFRGSWRVIFLYRLADEKHLGSTGHLQMNELDLAAILLAADEVTSHNYYENVEEYLILKTEIAATYEVQPFCLQLQVSDWFTKLTSYTPTTPQ